MGNSPAPSKLWTHLKRSRAVTQPASALVLIAWLATVLVNRFYLQTSVNLATDLSRYGSTARWRGAYYRGAKIGFTVRQVLRIDDGFRLEEDGQLEMTLLGATTAARIRTSAEVDNTFTLRSCEFSLDPGTGPITIHGRVDRAAAGSLAVECLAPTWLSHRRSRSGPGSVPCPPRPTLRARAVPCAPQRVRSCMDTI